MQLVKDFHLNRAQRLPPSLEIALDLHLEILFLFSVLVGILPVELGLCEFNLCRIHFLYHLLKLFRMFSNKLLNLAFFSDIMTLVGSE